MTAKRLGIASGDKRSPGSSSTFKFARKNDGLVALQPKTDHGTHVDPAMARELVELENDLEKLGT